VSIARLAFTAPPRGKLKRQPSRETFLCATDATQASGSALRTALRLAGAAGAKLVVVHVVESLDERGHWYRPVSRAERLAYQELLDKQVAAVGQRLRQQLHAAERGAVAEVRVVVKSGAVASTVLETALELDASLIVVGKGRTPGAIAPTAERIGRTSPRPVLLVPVKWTRGARVRSQRPRAKERRAPLRAVS
jgi:nucleotide-binding universal stress UspA family protein